MFRFVFAWQPGDDFAPLATNGFVGVECCAHVPPGVAVVGERLAGRRPGEATGLGGAITAGISPPAGRFGYGIYPTEDGRPPHVTGHALRDTADWQTAAHGRDRYRILVENGPTYATAHALWTLLEAAGPPDVIGVALDLAAARAAGQTAAVLVPTLNLRIGLVRVRGEQDDLADYARRLAGIGFDGYVVLDPPAGPARPAAAIALAGVFRGISPVKPVKKPAPAKPAARPAVTPST